MPTVRQKRKNNFGTVQWRNRHEVECSQNQIDENYRASNVDKTVAECIEQTKTQQKTKEKGDTNVGQGSGDGHDGLAPFLIAQVVRIERHGPGPTDDEATEKIRNDRQNERAEPLQMFQWVKCQSPGILGCVVALKIGGIAVRDLVNNDRHYQY